MNGFASESINAIHRHLDAEQLHEILEQLPNFVYQIRYYPDGRRQYLYVGERVKMFNITPAELLENADLLFDRIHPDDQAHVNEERVQAAHSMRPWHGQFRMRLPDESYIWVQCFDRPHQQADDSIIFTGYCTDITRYKYLEEQLVRKEAKFRTLVENANDIIYTHDAEGIVTYVSPNWAEKLGHSQLEIEQHIVGHSVAPLLHPDDIERLSALFHEIIDSGEKVSDMEVRLRHKDEGWRNFSVSATPLYDSQGRFTELLGIMRDVTEQKKDTLLMIHRANHDELTRLPKRSLLFDRIEQSLHLAQRKGTQLAVLYIDLDKFKPVNDTLGHGTGDIMLQECARRMQECVRSTDTVSRVGGDEFIVLLPEVTSRASAVQVAEKIRAALTEHFVAHGQSVQISCCIGVALFPHHGHTREELIHRADTAMYHAKSVGGNAIKVAEE